MTNSSRLKWIGIFATCALWALPAISTTAAPPRSEAEGAIRRTAGWMELLPPSAKAAHGDDQINGNGEQLVLRESYIYHASSEDAPAKVLVYADDAYHTPSAPEAALQDLGIGYVWYNSLDDFIAALNSGSWDLVILAEDFYSKVDASEFTAVQAYLAASPNHKAVVESWAAAADDLRKNNPLWSEMGVTLSSKLTSPQSLYWWSPHHPLFNSPQDAPPYTDLAPLGYLSYGSAAAVAGEPGSALGGFTQDRQPGQAGIVWSDDGRTLYKGIIDAPNNADLNDDGIWDAEQWWQNALRLLYPRSIRVLLATTDAFTLNPMVTALAGYGDIAAVDRFHTENSTPSLALLKQYDVVVAYCSGNPYQDPAAMGDALADYVDAGGKVVLAGHNWLSGNYGLGGRFESGGYDPYLSLDHTNSGYALLGTSEQGHRMLWGVQSLSSYFQQSLILAPGARLVASWDSGLDLIASKGSVVGINCYVGGYLTYPTTGDLTTLLHNTVVYLTSPRILMVMADTGPSTALAGLKQRSGVALLDAFDARSATPTQNLLQGYDAVLVWSDGVPFASGSQLGDELADYVDGGGKVIPFVNAWFDDTGDYGLAGRFASGGYNPFVMAVGGGTHYVYAGLGSRDDTHPILQGMSTLQGYFRNFVTLDASAFLLASWDDGEGLLAEKGSVVGVNAYVGESDDGQPTTGDVAILARNAVDYLYFLGAKASAVPTSGSAPVTVHFQGTGRGGTGPYTYDWDFGDGTDNGSDQDVDHLYASEGTYRATLTVADALGRTATDHLSITVTAPLSVSASAAPSSGGVPLAVHLSASVSGGTAPYAFDWDFGDGSAHDTAQSPTHTYGTVDTFTATVTVTDSAPSPHTASSSVTILVTVPPPVITFMKKVGNPFRISVTGSNLQSGIRVFINGSEWTNIKYKRDTLIKVKGGGSLKALVPKNVLTHFRFLNPDGGETELDWQWP
jgi:PKD repeat protein